MSTTKPFPSDLEIARSVTPRPILEVARALGIRDDEVEQYGPTKAKVTHNDRGKWLVAEKDKRKAKEIDVAWLKDYVVPK